VKKLWLVSAAALIMAAAGARGQDADWRPSDALKDENSIRPPRLVEGRPNAAVQYYKVWDSVPRSERRTLEQGSSDASEARSKPGAKLTPEQRRLCEERRDYIDGLLAASNNSGCVWGVNKDVGWESRLPHLGQVRHSVRVIRLDAYRCIDDRNYTGAAERVAAMIRMADQLRSDGVMISALTGSAVCSVALSVEGSMIREHQLNPGAARIILSAIKPLPKDDLFGFTSSLATERQSLVEWVRQRFKGEHAGTLLMQEIGQHVSRDPLDQFIYGLSEQQLSADLDRFGKYFDAAGAAWKRPDRALRISELDLEVWEGQYGMVARVLCPSISLTARSFDRTLRELDNASRELEAIVKSSGDGLDGPAGVGVAAQQR
jgi:hypothetical protein